MKKIKSLLVALVLMLITVCYSYSMEFKNIVVLGDSLSDNGNLFGVHGSYPPYPYYQGRVSDGPVWCEYLAEELGFTGMILNYAYAGAQTGDTNVNDDDLNGNFPGFADEVKAYLDLAAISIKYQGGFAMPKDTLFIIWIGSNDFSKITDPMTQIAQGALNIENVLPQLIDAGASKFLVMNVPDLGKTPRTNKDATMSAGASQVSAGFDHSLEQVLAKIETEHPNIAISRFDSFSMLSEFIDNAQTLGFTNVKDSKLNTSDGTIAEGNYLFWDDIHPTTFAHKLIAKKVAEAINCENCKGNMISSSMMPQLGNDLTLKVPSARLGNNSYGFTLVPYQNPNEPGIFWSLDMTSIQVK